MARGIDQEPRLDVDQTIEKLRAGQELARITTIQTTKVVSGTFEGVDQDPIRWDAFNQYAVNRFYRDRFVEAKGFDAVRFKPDFEYQMLRLIILSETRHSCPIISVLMRLRQELRVE